MTGKKGYCVECDGPRGKHTISCRWDHSCIRNDGGTPGRRCFACELEEQAVETPQFVETVR